MDITKISLISDEDRERMKKNKSDIIMLKEMYEDLSREQEEIEKKKKEIKEEEFLDRRDPKVISHLTELKNIKELLELIYNEAREQRKIAKKIIN